MMGTWGGVPYSTEPQFLALDYIFVCLCRISFVISEVF